MSDAVIDRLRERDLLELVKRVAREHYVTVEEVCGRGHGAAATAARHVVWAEIRANTPLSLPDIGKLFDRDHCTVLAGIRKAAPRLARAALKAI